ncbi:hypothetical protein PI126_g18032, partial [Phytophthora idaei]
EEAGPVKRVECLLLGKLVRVDELEGVNLRMNGEWQRPELDAILVQGVASDSLDRDSPVQSAIQLRKRHLLKDSVDHNSDQVILLCTLHDKYVVNAIRLKFTVSRAILCADSWLVFYAFLSALCGLNSL